MRCDAHTKLQYELLTTCLSRTRTVGTQSGAEGTEHMDSGTT